ncbi:hypothetical protein [uncultured Megasphaera sp.]|uniref:hypothetical protein n=1 Tax=uncultured Megasphaera sp. TaxID=165188 RepID=UPI002657CDE5|nr:hypothetical protein [uncultured Megasphaera sp.]
MSHSSAIFGVIYEDDAFFDGVIQGSLTDDAAAMQLRYLFRQIAFFYKERDEDDAGKGHVTDPVRMFLVMV